MHTLIKSAIITGTAVFALVLLWQVSGPAVAQECAGTTRQKVLDDLAGISATFFGTIDYAGEASDSVTFYEYGGAVWMVFLNGDCFVTGPSIVDTSPPAVSVPPVVVTPS